jgi:hypothetical protein
MSSNTNGLNGNGGISDKHMAAIALAEAMNKARLDQTTMDKSRAETRLTSAQRLETLKAKLQPLYAAIPTDVEGFELGIVQADKQRLFLDMLAFVEATPDGFRLIQQTRKGRNALGDSTSDAGMVELVTAYIARRLVQREQALSTDATQAVVAHAPTAHDAKAVVEARAETVSRADDVSDIVPGKLESLHKPDQLRPPGDLVPKEIKTAPVTAAPVEPVIANVSAPNGIRQMPAQRTKSGGWFWMLLAALIGLGAGAGALFFAFENIRL